MQKALLLSTGIALALLLQVGGQAQQMYRWVDKNGKVTYSQDPPPAGTARKVEQKNLQSSVIETGGLSYATQQAAKNFPVTLYTMPDCDLCQRGRKLLQSRGVPFKEVSVEDDAGMAQLKKLSGQDQLPVLSIGRNVTPGFAAEAWNQSLDSVGYPKSGEPNNRAASSSTAAATPPAAKNPPPAASDDSTPAAAPVPAPPPSR